MNEISHRQNLTNAKTKSYPKKAKQVEPTRSKHTSKSTIRLEKLTSSKNPSCTKPTNSESKQKAFRSCKRHRKE